MNEVEILLHGSFCWRSFRRNDVPCGGWQLPFPSGWESFTSSGPALSASF